MTATTDRTVYVVRLTATKGTDPARALRRLLKYAGRACGLRCIGCRLEGEGGHPDEDTNRGPRP